MVLVIGYYNYSFQANIDINKDTLTHLELVFDLKLLRIKTIIIDNDINKVHSF